MNTPRCRLSALGVVSALGAGISVFRRRLLEGSNHFFSQYPTKVGERSLMVGAVNEELPVVAPEFHRYASRNFQLALSAARQIEAEVLRLKDQHGAGRIAVVMGSSTSGIGVGEVAVKHYLKSGQYPSDYEYSQQELGSVADGIRDYFGLKGISYTVSTACSSSSKVFQSAKRLLENNLCDAVIVGGADSLCEMTLRGFTALELTSSDLCNPFSVNRDGINIGEGAAIFLLERETGGVQLCGVGESSDAYHLSAPEPEGKGAAAAMKAALRDAEINPQQINYLNLHGTGTYHNDLAESRAVEAVFGDDKPYCSSSKSLLGHTLGASGAIELGVCWSMLSMEGSYSRPVHVWDGCFDPDLPKLPLISESNSVEAQGPIYSMSNSFAFGGSNCSIIIGVC